MTAPMHDHARRRPAAITVVAIVIGLLTLSRCGRHVAGVPAVGRDYSDPGVSPNFKTSLDIAATHDGLIGDGTTDNTNAFRALLGSGDRTIRIAAGTYVTGSISVPNNTAIYLQPGVTIKDSGGLGPNDRLIDILGQNVYISGTGAKVLSDRSYYRGGEQRHGVFIYGASNVVITGLASSSNSGDGFYIGGPPGRAAQNITLENCSAPNNRRQGLSITSGRDIMVSHCTFSLTQGTAPSYGVDLEPNYPADPLQNIHLIGVRTAGNFGGGILVALGKLDGTSMPISIRITGHISADEERSYTLIRPKDVTGDLTYTPAR